MAGTARARPDESQQYAALILKDRDVGRSERLPAEYLPAFQKLWTDTGIQQAIAKGNEFALHDNLA